MPNPFGWRSATVNRIILDENNSRLRVEEFARLYSEAELKQPNARRKGSQPQEEYIPDSLTVIGNWNSDKLWN